MSYTLLLPEYLESLLAPNTPLTPLHPLTLPGTPKWPPHWFPGGVTYLIKTRQVTQMSYAALYKHVALFAVTIYKYVHTSPNHIFLHQICKNAMRTISTPDQFTHILSSTILRITTPRYHFHSFTSVTLCQFLQYLSTYALLSSSCFTTLNEQ